MGSAGRHVWAKRDMGWRWHVTRFVIRQRDRWWAFNHRWGWSKRQKIREDRRCKYLMLLAGILYFLAFWIICALTAVG